MKIYILSPLYMLLFAVLLLSSCGSRKSAVNSSAEIARVSQQLGIEIKKNDKHLPLYIEASSWLGVRYKYAGLTRSGIDCSGLVYNIYMNAYNKKVSRSTTGLVKETKDVAKKHLKTGDLVFFATDKKKKKISHVGIFLKDGYFIHASSSKGVIVSSLDSDYYVRAWKNGGRFKE